MGFPLVRGLLESHWSERRHVALARVSLPEGRAGRLGSGFLACCARQKTQKTLSAGGTPPGARGDGRLPRSPFSLRAEGRRSLRSLPEGLPEGS